MHGIYVIYLAFIGPESAQIGPGQVPADGPHPPGASQHQGRGLGQGALPLRNHPGDPGTQAQEHKSQRHFGRWKFEQGKRVLASEYEIRKLILICMLIVC